jgi:16S rRNA (guanine527-N7)-methyltransferase
VDKGLQVSEIESVSGLAGVSRETRGRLEIYRDLLVKWQARINLVAPSTLEDAWVRHFADSAQLIAHAPDRVRLWLDVGSGAGFPGLVAGIMLMETHPDSQVCLIESDTRKCAFLQSVVAETGAPVKVIPMRVEKAEAAVAALGHTADVISARAVAPMPRLMEMIAPYWSQGCIGLFLKGRDVASELTEAAKYWTIRASHIPSSTPGDGVILKLEELALVRPEHPH